MEREKVDSSQILSIGHDAEKNKMEIEFNSGSVYRYDNIDSELFESLKNSQSIGKFFGQKIKSNSDKYPFEKIRGPFTAEEKEEIKKQKQGEENVCN